MCVCVIRVCVHRGTGDSVFHQEQRRVCLWWGGCMTEFDLLLFNDDAVDACRSGERQLAVKI